jgi:hypothetical protein
MWPIHDQNTSKNYYNYSKLQTRQQSLIFSRKNSFLEIGFTIFLINNNVLYNKDSFISMRELYYVIFTLFKEFIQKKKDLKTKSYTHRHYFQPYYYL